MKWFPAKRSFRNWIKRKPRQKLVAVDGVSIDVGANETLGIVGESGSGKTTLARCIVRLYEPDGGSIQFDGKEITEAGRRELRKIHGRIQMVFQDPYSSLNPRLSVASAVLEAGKVHDRVGSRSETAFVDELLDMVGLTPAVADRRPRELSGGQRQRVVIARALAAGPELIIADEPVSALDVSIQAQVLNLFDELRDDLGLSLILIAHQLSVISQVSDRVGIMYLGRIVEYGPTERIFSDPQHPYTRALLAAHPEPDPQRRKDYVISGDAPSPLAIPRGCRFRTRCPYSEDVCEESDPHLESVPGGHQVACHIRPFASSQTTEP